jgi:hypothetical protein
MFRELLLSEARKLGLDEQIAGMEHWPDSAVINVPVDAQPEPVVEHAVAQVEPVVELATVEQALEQVDPQ